MLPYRMFLLPLFTSVVLCATEDFEVDIEDGGRAGQPFTITAQKKNSPTKSIDKIKSKALPADVPEIFRNVAETLQEMKAPALGNLDGVYDMMSAKVVDSDGKTAASWDPVRANKFDWVPIDDDQYTVTVTGRKADGSITEHTSTVTVEPSEGASESTHPLVLHYGAPACNDGSVSIRFRKAGDKNNEWVQAPGKPCRGEGKNINFYAAGLLPSTAYELQHKYSNSNAWSASSIQSTGEIDIDIPVNYVHDQGPVSKEGGAIIHHHLIASPHDGLHVIGGTTATDMNGDIIWYTKNSWTDYKHLPTFFFTTPSPSKTDRFIAVSGEPNPEMPNNPAQVLMQRNLRVHDMAGNTISTFTVDEINKKLEAQGKHKIYMFHHDSLIKEDGNIVALVGHERIYDDFPGYEGKKIDLLMDGFIELTPEGEVVYTWNWFDHVDPKTGRPKQDERCDVKFPGTSSCGLPLLFEETVTEEDPNGIWFDWSHINSIQYVPEDGSILLGSRNQNTVIKVDYARGKGDGSIIWTLGKDGDFELVPAHEDDPYPWFSAQHSPRIYNNKHLVLFDNSNQRVLPGLEGNQSGTNSRGQVYSLDYDNMVATQTMSEDLDGFSYYWGSSQRVENGDNWFLSGQLSDKTVLEKTDDSKKWFTAPKGKLLHSHDYQYSDNGDEKFKMDNEGAFSYRSFKMKNMYEQSIPNDYNVCCVDDDCGPGRTCSCQCEGTSTKSSPKTHRLRALLFGHAEQAKPEMCGCQGFL